MAHGGGVGKTAIIVCDKGYLVAGVEGVST